VLRIRGERDVDEMPMRELASALPGDVEGDEGVIALHEVKVSRPGSAKVVVDHAWPRIGAEGDGSDVEPDEGDEGNSEGDDQFHVVTSLAHITDLDFLSGY
jgi:hypothetical protein